MSEWHLVSNSPFPQRESIIIEGGNSMLRVHLEQNKGRTELHRKTLIRLTSKCNPLFQISTK
jgi:hypothetical protein